MCFEKCTQLYNCIKIMTFYCCKQQSSPSVTVPWESVFCFLLLLLFLKFHINVITNVQSSLCLASFIQYNVFETYPHVCVCHSSSLLIAEQYLIAWMFHNLFIFSLVNEHKLLIFGFFKFVTIVTEAIMNTHGESFT